MRAQRAIQMYLSAATFVRQRRETAFAMCGTTSVHQGGWSPQTPGGSRTDVLGCGLGVAVEEVDFGSQYVIETRSTFVDIVVATGTAEQFRPRRLAGDLECGRDWRNRVCRGDDEEEGDT